MGIRSASLVGLAALLMAVNIAAGAHVLWNTSTEDNWANLARWSSGSVPGNADSAEIGQGAGNGGTAVVNTTVDDILYWRLGETGGETGTLKIQPGGSLTSTSSGANYVGYEGIGYLEVGGGSLDIAAGNLMVGYRSTGRGTVTQTGGSISVYDNTYLSENVTGIGYYNLDGGTITSRRFLVGLHGIGIMTQTGGTLNVDGYSSPDLTLGWYTDGRGTYNLSGGQVNVLGTYRMKVGNGGTGVFNQSGGAVSVNRVLSIADADTADGTYNLGDGTVSAYQINVGNGGTAVFNQSGGTVSSVSIGSGEPDIYVGLNADSNGTYNLSGPTALVETVDDLLVGFRGTGLLQQSGGTVDVADSLFVSYYSTSQGTYRQTGGLVTLGNDAYLGYGNGSNGTYDLSGGQLDVTDTLFVGNAANSTGVGTLSGGKISANVVTIGNAGSGTLRQTGGELDVASYIGAGSSATGQGAYKLEGGSVSAPRLLIGLFGTAVLTQTGGDIAVSADLTLGWYNDTRGTGYGTYIVSGGTVAAGTLRNGNSGFGYLRIVGGGATITPEDFRQNSLSTLETQIDNDGISPIAVNDDATLAGSLDVNLRGGTALLADTAFDLITAPGGSGVISGIFAAETEPLWDVSQTSTYVRATIDVTDSGPLAVRYGGLGEIAIDGGSGTNFGYSALTGIDPNQDFWMLLDVEKNGLDLTGTELDSLADHVRADVRTVSTDLPLLNDGTLAGYNLAILMDPVPGSSYFAWDFSDYDTELRVAHLAAGVPEPTSLVLLLLASLLLVGRRRGER